MIRFSIKNALLANLLLGLILIIGILSWQAMPQEMFPNIALDKVRISTVFKGASPEEIETQITLPIEQEIEGMNGIDTLVSSSSESISNITIKLNHGSNIDEFLRDIETTVARINSDLPDSAEQPEIVRIKARIPVISVALHGAVSNPLLFQTAKAVKDQLIEIPGVSSASISGNRDWELWVIVDPSMLSAMHISLNEILSALKNNLDNLPGGHIESAEGDILLRGQGASPNIEAIGQIAVRTTAEGGILRLNAVASIEKRLEEVKTLGRFNGQPSINITITKTPESSSLEISDAVHAQVENWQKELPNNIHIKAFSDRSVYLKNRLDTVKSSAIIGLGLVLLSLYLFLNFRVAFVTALGIPVSFLVGIILMNYLGQSVNMISLFAFLIALGMVVDDAIIVTENIYRHMELGLPAQQAAIVGTKEVLWPVVASTATTVAAFIPMFGLTGSMGTFITVIPIVVIACLLGSLLEAFGVLPSHAAHLLHVKPTHQRDLWSRLVNRYTRLVRTMVKNRYLVSSVTIAVLIVSIAFAATRIPFMLFGDVEIGLFFINIEAPKTYSLKDSERLAMDLENEIIQELGDKDLKSLLTNLGIIFIDFNTIKFDSNYIQFIIDLEKPEPKGFIERWISPIARLSLTREGSRQRSTEDIINEIRQRFKSHPGIERFSILMPAGGPAGPDVEIGISGTDNQQLQILSKNIADYLNTLSGIHDIAQDLTPGKQEIRYALNELGRRLGLTQSQLASTIRSGYQGTEIAHITLENTRVPVRVIFPESIRHYSDKLAQLPIILANGETVYLGNVANIKKSRGFNTIKHRDLKTLATVTAEVDAQQITALQVSELVQKKFKNSLPDGYQLIFLGEKKEANESMEGMLKALIIALAVIFIILVALFKSLLDPFVILLAIPFGIIGVIFGHVITGHMLQFLSMIGFLALSGIVVNDSLILIDFAKKLRRKKVHRYEAIIEACRIRARPIILTSLTTFLGVSPLIFFATGQTAFLSPMAVSLGFGLLFATVLILIVLPCFYIIADDLRIHWIAIKRRFRSF